MKKTLVFYYLSGFAEAGGIETFNRCMIKALDELQAEGYESTVLSVYDDKGNDKYHQLLSFYGFKKKRAASLLFAIRRALRSDVLILGHVNLGIAGFIIKILRPKCHVIMVAHGIEAWQKLSVIQRKFLNSSDIIFSVSNYTKNQLVLQNRINPEKIRIFPNAIDPFFNIPDFTCRPAKPGYLIDRYGLHQGAKVILTLSRLSGTNHEKGYDQVIASLPAVLQSQPDAIYILAGKCDAKEKVRICNLLEELGLSGKVILPGLISQEEVEDHYLLADVFVMPSRKEGFGIAFIEALACGLNVIGGNSDGTVDALQSGSFGVLVNPVNVSEIGQRILQGLTGKRDPVKLQKNVLEAFSFESYQRRFCDFLYSLN